MAMRNKIIIMFSISCLSSTSFAQKDGAPEEVLQIFSKDYFKDVIIVKGAGSSGGGDLPLLSEYVDLTPDSDKVEYYKAWMFRLARFGLEELEKFAWLGYEFHDKEGNTHLLDVEKLREARKLVNEFYNTNKKVLILDSSLKNPKTGNPRMAQNAKGGKFWLNPMEFSQQLSESYSADFARLIRASVITHEFLSQVGLESTGIFIYSQVLTNKELIKQTREAYDNYTASLFGKRDPLDFYGCNIEVFRKIKDVKYKVWQNAVPIKTYLKWSLGSGHMDEFDGKAYIPNPNYIVGTSAGCYSAAPLEVNGLAKPLMVSQDAYKFLYKINKETYLDFCYVVGDSAGRYDGGGRFVIRYLGTKEDSWHKFDYKNQFEPFELEGAQNAVFSWKDQTVGLDLDIEISCGPGVGQ